MAKAFQKLPRLVQLLLLLIPGVNWVVEIVVRVSAVLEKTTLYNVIGVIFGIFVPVINGWIDLIWILLFGHLLFTKV